LVSGPTTRQTCCDCNATSNQVRNGSQADTTEGTIKRMVTGAVSSIRAKGEADGAVCAKRLARATGKSRGKEPELTK
jgi:hypothetical protein